MGRCRVARHRGAGLILVLHSTAGEAFSSLTLCRVVFSPFFLFHSLF